MFKQACRKMIPDETSVYASQPEKKQETISVEIVPGLNDVLSGKEPGYD